MSCNDFTCRALRGRSPPGGGPSSRYTRTHNNTQTPPPDRIIHRVPDEEISEPDHPVLTVVEKRGDSSGSSVFTSSRAPLNEEEEEEEEEEKTRLKTNPLVLLPGGLTGSWSWSRRRSLGIPPGGVSRIRRRRI